MMEPFEKQLKDALRREEPPLGFAARVAARAREQEKKSWWAGLLAARLRWAVVLAICVVMVGGILLQHKRERERAEGEAAKQQVKLALQIAGSKVKLARNLVQKINDKSLESEQ